MRPTVLVVSCVHPPDDPRIRLKLIESLRREAEVRYATRAPGPSEPSGIDVELLEGSRMRRMLAASRRIIAGRYDVASVHDPELLPAAIVAGLLRRRVVFDVHEDIPAQMSLKRWFPGPVGVLAKAVSAGLLRLAERVIDVTLAEPNYAGLFRAAHPVFPNYLAGAAVDPVPISDRGGAVYLGDITEIRGLITATEAVAMSTARPALTLIGRCAAPLRSRIEAIAADAGVPVEFTGFLPLAEALPVVARSAVALSPLHDVANYRHSLPTKLLEYLALGVPVVASDLPGSRGVVGDLPGIVWVSPGDPVALANGIDLVLSSERLPGEAAAGATEVAERYRWPDEAVRAFYREVAADSAGR